ncbi:MAG: SH3 domain-containing protein [Cyanobacteria bacterium P01_F01_bin.56]
MTNINRPKPSSLRWLNVLGTTGLITGALTLLGTVFVASFENLSRLRLERQKYEFGLIENALNDLPRKEGDELEQAQIDTAEHLKFMVDIGAISSLDADKIEEYAANPESLPKGRIFPPAGVVYVSGLPGFNVNLYSGPGTTYSVVNTLRRGTPITITGFYEHGWAQLSDRSWIAGNMISSAPPSPPPSAEPVAATAYVAASDNRGVNTRSGPGPNYSVIDTLSPGTAVRITGNFAHGWAELEDGSWIVSNLIQIGSPTETQTEN